MALIHNSLGNLFGGVSQQPAVDRRSHQVEEMINCVPTVDSGLLKRNPMVDVNADALSLTSETYSYEYDRGYAAVGSKERYSLQVNKDEAKVVNLSTGKVYTKGSGLTYESDSAEEYLTNFSGINGYAGTTIKDTTFIANKTITPKIIPIKDDPEGLVTENRDYVTLEFKTIANGKEPATVFKPDEGGHRAYKAHTSITIKGITINHGGDKFTHYTDYVYGAPMDGYLNTLVDKIQNALGTQYKVTRRNADGQYLSLLPIRIDSLDPLVSLNATDVTVLISDVANPNPSVYGKIVSASNATHYSQTRAWSIIVNLRELELSYKEFGYIWIRRSNPVTPYYTYRTRITIKNKTTEAETVLSEVSVANATTEGAAGALATAITALVGVAAESWGSIVKISADSGYEVLDVDCSDTDGGLAMSGWSHTISSIDDLPNNFPYKHTIVKVTGFDTDENNDYWVKKIEDLWTEHYDPEIDRYIDASTMPHILVRNEDDTFTFKQYDKWNERLIGDNETNGIPSFIGTEENPEVKIKDIFFFKNRLGFITDKSLVMSESGTYGNFWRTSVVSLLDNDRIDGVVDTTKAIRLEYASNLEDILVLFADNVQFRVTSGDVLSPKTVKVSQASAYSVNVSVRPLFMNNEIFFCVNRGLYTQVMKYRLSEQAGKNIIGEDVTIQVPRYISNNVSSFTHSPVNDMLFITTLDELDTVYVYKMVKLGQEVVQSSWFKWKFQADIFKAFAFEDKLYMLTATYDAPDSDDWVLANGTWNNSGFWHHTDKWRMSSDTIAKTSKVQSIEIFNNLGDQVYLDNEVNNYTSTVDIGEWVYGKDGAKESRGHLQLKTIQIEAEDYSVFDLHVENIKRNSVRIINSKYTNDRKPMVHGNSKDIRLSIVSDSHFGFKINNVSLEGNFNIRSRRS